MNLDQVEKIARAVLYEGYLLYPYRPSAIKNRQRWNFGVLYPKSYAAAQDGTDAWIMQTECLIRSSTKTVLNVRVRFLQLVERSEYPNRHPRACWQEAVEREVCVPAIQVWELFDSSFTQHFSFPALQREEPKRDAEHDGSATILYRQETVSGVIEISGLRCLDGVSKITVRVRNQDPFEMTSVSNRDDALMKSLVSTHTILGLHEGEFVSLLDPPNALQELAASCRNVGTWPVLAGEPGGRDTMLSSPIILYDYPQVAPESTGDLFDATEIDEILSLRIMALTDEEKSEIRTSDSRARQILERTDNIPPEQLMKLHGVLRGLRPLKEDAHE